MQVPNKMVDFLLVKIQEMADKALSTVEDEAVKESEPYKVLTMMSNHIKEYLMFR